MKRATIILIHILLIWGAGAQMALGQAPVSWDYHFPLDIAPKVSGSFGEVRSNHFHSGLDLTTFGKTGYPVFAAESGYVSRVSVSPGGFGKALYIDHPDGVTTVYAHLKEFCPRVDSVVTRLQYKQESFSMNTGFEEGKLPVTRGEVIGYSGNSGSSGGPHLHFEIRETKGQRPLDPLAFENPVKDDIRPQIKGIMVYPLSENAVINGEHEPKYYPCVFYDGAFHLKHNPEIKAGGKVGIGIEVIDYYTGSWRKCGVHSIDLKMNGHPLYNYTMNGFYFHNTRYLNSHIDYAEKKKNHRTIQKSFVDPYNPHELYEVGPDRGEIIPEEGKIYQLDYTVKDISGNVSELNFKLKGASPQSSGNSEESRNVPMIDPSEPYSYEEEGHSVSFPPESFYREIPPVFDVSESEKSLSGTVFSVLDETIPIHNRYEIRIPIASDLETDGLCGAVLPENGEPEYAGGSAEGTHFVIESRSGGDYILVRDTVPPQIKVKNKPSGMDYRRRDKLVVDLEDDFSGIDQYEATINGKWALFEYDAKNDQIICYFDKVPFLHSGNKYELVIEATDQAGNNEKLKTRFRY
ncbi:MAG: M23 family metallopeptidase [Bacteroidota bacterium]